MGLAKRGINIGVLARNREAVDQVASRARELGVTAAAADVDVTDLEQVRSAVGQLTRQLGDIDLLVNNAGAIDEETVLWEADPQDWWSVVETNLRGPFHLAHTLIPHMLRAGGGRIVNLATGLAGRDFPYYSAYGAAKSGLLRMGGAIHEAGWARGLRTFEMSPGVVRTDMTAGMPMHDGREQWTDPEEVVELLAAIARGELDHWAGRYLRAGTDSPQHLRATTPPNPESRRLRIVGLP